MFLRFSEGISGHIRYIAEKLFSVHESCISTVHRPSKVMNPEVRKQFDRLTSGELGKTVTACACSPSESHAAPILIFAC
jgi:hypothetical protein